MRAASPDHAYLPLKASYCRHHPLSRSSASPPRSDCAMHTASCRQIVLRAFRKLRRRRGHFLSPPLAVRRWQDSSPHPLLKVQGDHGVSRLHPRQTGHACNGNRAGRSLSDSCAITSPSRWPSAEHGSIPLYYLQYLKALPSVAPSLCRKNDLNPLTTPSLNQIRKESLCRASGL